MKKLMVVKSICMRGLVSVAVILICTGCASIMNGSKQRVKINSEPAGAMVTAEGETATTPATMVFKSVDMPTIVISKAGFQPQIVPMKRENSGWVYGNLIFGIPFCLLGFDIDIWTGAYNVLEPTKVNVTLHPLPAGGTATQPSETGFRVVSDVNQPLSDPKMTRICVLYGGSRSLGAKVAVRISDGEAIIGSAWTKTYACWECLPGQQTISVDYGRRSSAIELDTQAGKTFYVLAKYRPPINQVDESQAKKMLIDFRPMKPERYVISK